MNLILITIDCLRADHLSCLGYSKRITPNLDDLASAGVLFSQVISASHWTMPSFISILTSTYPLMYGGQLYITKPRTSVAQVLKEHGYHTTAFHSNPWLSSYFGYHKGFDTFDDSIPKGYTEGLLSRPKELIKRIIGTNGRLYKFLSQVYGALIASHPYGKGEELNRKAIQWLHNNPSNFFIWLHYMDVHEPYLPPQKSISPFGKYRFGKLNRKAHDEANSLLPEELNKLIDLYDAGISYVDELIGSLLRMLRRGNILDDTFIIVTADHGQQFMEHGHYGHGLGLYDELIHVPLIITGPGLESQVINQQISLLDLAPTILDMFEVGKPRTFMGNSLLPLMSGNKIKAGNSQAISETDASDKYNVKMNAKPQIDTNQKVISLRTGEWKYIYTEGGQDELYCLGDDPKETKNIIDIEPEIAAELRAKIMAHIEFEGKSALGEEELIKVKIRRLKGGGKI